VAADFIDEAIGRNGSAPHTVHAGRYRVLQYVSDAFVLFGCAAFAVVVGKQWAWAPFIGRSWSSP
jgi:hypothetical protein